MRIFFVSHDFSGISLCRRLRDEGHEVRAWVERADCRGYAEQELVLTRDRAAGVRWVGHDGLIVCDYVGFGAWQDRLRGAGYAVVGGCAAGDRLELDRTFGQRVLAKHGLQTLPTHRFATAAMAAKFIRKNPAAWVLKLNGNADRTTTYVGELPDGADVLDMLAGLCPHAGNASVVLQRCARGIEIAVARYFNGHDWVGPVETDVEHKRLFPGDLGPNTPEMGTLMWYDGERESRLYQETLAKLRPWLQRVNFRGALDLNLIVNETGAFPLEATARFGYPAMQLQMELHRSPWGEFLKAVACGRNYPLLVRRGYGIAVLVATPPFPFGVTCAASRPRCRMHSRSPLSPAELNRIQFEGIVPGRSQDGHVEYALLDPAGQALTVTGMGRTISGARAQAYQLVEKIVLPQMYYRRDIGMAFATQNRRQLKEWNWL